MRRGCTSRQPPPTVPSLDCPAPPDSWLDETPSKMASVVSSRAHAPGASCLVILSALLHGRLSGKTRRGAVLRIRKRGGRRIPPHQPVAAGPTRPWEAPSVGAGGWPFQSPGHLVLQSLAPLMLCRVTCPEEEVRWGTQPTLPSPTGSLCAAPPGTYGRGLLQAPRGSSPYSWPLASAFTVTPAYHLPGCLLHCHTLCIPGTSRACGCDWGLASVQWTGRTL